VHAVNERAPSAAKVAVWGPISAAEPFFREDLEVSAMPASPPVAPVGDSLAIGCSWAILDEEFFPTGEIVWTVERDGARLAIVKRQTAADAGPG
jgi:hypothetical protein